MKTTITRTLLVTLVLLLGSVLHGFAQTSTYHDVYICGNTSIKLRVSNESTLVNGDKVHWYLGGVEVTGSPFTYTTSGTADLTVPAGANEGLYTYTSAIESTGGCLGDLSEPYRIYKLPTKTLALSTDKAAYCGDNSGPAGAVITATTTPAGTLPAGIDYAYEWTVTTGTPPVTATPGSHNNSSAATSLYTMTTTTPGTYVFNAKVKYVLASGNTGTLVSADTNGCEVTAGATEQVIVTPKPTKPTITFTAN